MENEIMLVGAFAGKTSKPQFNQLSAGDVEVKLSRVEWTNSFTNYDGTEKDSLPKWSDANPQVVETFVSVKPGEGAHTQRHQAFGYYHADDLSDAEISAGKMLDAKGKLTIPFEVSQGYVLVKNKEGKLTRIVHEGKTQACKNILDQQCSAAGIEEGVPFPEAFARMRDEGKTFIIRIALSTEYEGKEQYRVTSYRPVKKTVEAGSLD
jgi:hypothetical protein